MDSVLDTTATTTPASVMVMEMDNMTDSEYLVNKLGPRHLGLQVLIPITLVYSVIFLTGVVGNLCVCLVIIRNKSLHTTTNYYLFSLALSDLVILVLGLPYELTMYWQQYPWIFGSTLCKVRALISEMTSYASVLTIVAFSMERYLAICHPLYQYAMSGFSRAVKIISFIWILSFSAAFPYAYFTRVNYIDRPLGSGNFLDESAFCALLDSNIVPKDYPLHQLSSVVFFLVPLLVLLYLYTRMGLRLHKSSNVTRNTNSRVHGNNRMSRNKDMVLKMLGRKRKDSVKSLDSIEANTRSILPPNNKNKRGIFILLAAVVLCFFFCWAPFHAQRLAYVYFRHTRTFGLVNEYLMYISGFFYYFSATVNPILYNVMSLKYRHAFKATLCGGDSTANGLSKTYTFRSTFNKTLDSDVNGTQISLNKKFREKTFNGTENNRFSGTMREDLYLEREMLDNTCVGIQEEEPSQNHMLSQNDRKSPKCLYHTPILSYRSQCEQDNHSSESSFNQHAEPISTISRYIEQDVDTESASPPTIMYINPSSDMQYLDKPCVMHIMH